ncbi:ABC-type Fe3+-hydroxamate transport system substrate-binding protein/AraC-like DNA-binding protein [Paenibacillus endophyticus]|uniref:ABC-type Fe3+-hydroxamate transport system substrate-binding protein/AraC-like DNA-binding protein n=1 Tax=Paenibacillus endophyticus TaxID=1294268 RepID=A0A7W5CA23_9BACL|nr:AraC family transcriptional regulator [Paenibacillus endophyticus]MBB3153931.1 ABC-type Fe3+-hydroxamate transport system substrate-binding protein/AraC-like DNA-binding protein [Paenibacillus endophyticus]
MGRQITNKLPFRDLFFVMQDIQYLTAAAGEQLKVAAGAEPLLLIVEAGNGLLQSEQGEKLLAQHMIQMIRPREQARIINDGQPTLGCFMITYKVYQAEKQSHLNSQLDNEPSDLVERNSVLEATDSIQDMVRSLFRAANTVDEQEAIANRFIFQKLVFALTEQQRFQKESKNPRLAVKRTLQYMERHLDEAISVEQLARLANISRRWYTVLFKEMTGENPLDYLIGLRIRKAKDLLNLSGDSFHIIARRVGFEDEHYFSRRFKQKVGLSPRYYLQQRRHFGTRVTYPELMHVLGVTPIAAPTPHQEFPYYLQASFGGVEKLHYNKILSLDKIRSSKPDLIVASEWQDQAIYEELSRIATTVLLPSREDWRDELRDMAEILGKRSEANAVIERFSVKLDQARETLYFAVKGETVVYVRLTFEGAVVFGEKSSRGRILYSELGLKPPDISALSQAGIILPLDRLSELKADHIILQTDNKKLWGRTNGERLTIGRESRIHQVGHAEWYNFSFSPLATHFAVDEMIQIFAARK